MASFQITALKAECENCHSGGGNRGAGAGVGKGDTKSPFGWWGRGLQGMTWTAGVSGAGIT